ncbi:MAG: TetR/AcrR family transcriptional regulator [Actinomycetota bacterium]|nr:TetR/AcrR family transcriptional regulator [Actinomycetota bacterium]
MAAQRITGREAQRLATRERLFTVAVAEFKRAGLAGADVGAIVAEAGVAHGTFYFHFPTKEHVLAELGQREEARLATELDRFLATPRDLRSTLVEVVRLAAALERRLGKGLFKDLIALYFSPNRVELRLWGEHPLIARVVTEFGLARDRGEIGDDPEVDPGNAALIFFMGFFALLVTFERSAREALLEQSITLLLRGLEPS